MRELSPRDGELGLGERRGGVEWAPWDSLLRGDTGPEFVLRVGAEGS